MSPNKNNGILFGVIIFALIVKFALFSFVSIYSPQGKLLPDSGRYLELASNIASKGDFILQNESGIFLHETIRTPGYPLFLAIFHNILRLPLDGIVFLQILMTVLAGLITYRTAMMIEPKLALLSAIIILFDPPIMIFSLAILTESLFLLIISLFMYTFTVYLKNKKTKHLILSAMILALSTYVRPVSYYLGFMIGLFILYVDTPGDIRNGFKRAFIFLFIMYSLVSLWQLRNYMLYHDLSFSSIENENSGKMLFNSYARNTDPYTKGMAPFPYYVNVSARCLMSLLTRPGNFKYFQCKALTFGSFIFSYPWMIFWLSGFILGAFKVVKDAVVSLGSKVKGRIGSSPDSLCLQFMVFVVLYFIVASICGLMWSVCERLRVPIMPFIAIVSAYGWLKLPLLFKKHHYNHNS